MKIRICDSDTRNNVRSGYGLMAYQLWKNLEVLGHEVVFFPDDKLGEDIVLFVRPPHYVKEPVFDPSKKNVFFTMHESETFDGWKVDWPELLNKCSAVITPTEWNKKVFEKNGVTVPIFVVPLGVNRKDFHGAKTDAFSIMTLHDALGKEGSRENWKDTIKAYHEAFAGTNENEVQLTIKSYNIDREAYRNYVVGLGRGTPPIDIVEIDLMKDSLNDLYSKHWLFVKNANREGWSLPLLEAMSTGMPVAHTNLPVFSWAEGYGKRQVFELGNTKQLAEIMQGEFRQWKKEKGFINQFSWKNCAKKVEQVLISI